MLIWIKRVGLLIIFLSSAMIITSYAQWYICQSKPIVVDQAGVGFKHCSYFRSGIEVILLLTGNIFVIASIILAKLSGKKTL